MSKVYICGAKRTPVGSYGGTLKDVSLGDLGAHCIKAVLDQTGLAPEAVDEVIIGNVMSADQGMGPARQASVKAGIPVERPAWAANMICGSGMKSIMLAAQAIQTGQSRVVMAGGMENMSSLPMLVPGQVRFGTKMGDLTMKDSLISDGLTDYFNNYHMGVTAENIAEKYAITREDQDKFAVDSQKKAAAARKEGRFKDEIAPITLKVRRKDVLFADDEYIKDDTTLEGLGKLRPAFKKDGTVTAGNSSGINDGASAVLVASDEAAEANGLTPMAEIVAFHQVGLDPAYMGMGPYYAIKGLMEKAYLSLDDVGLIELNEAFASQSIGCVKALAEDFSVPEQSLYDKINVNGGAIAIGHPLGASGNRILVTLLYEMKKRNVEYGIASLCIGGGMGVAMLIKNVK
ncbi:acetyl-CoA C-acetyltransferase [Spirochaeta isovalerica]|uniref:Acetyl-CoA C-acetyltransferase n=1 Tax=Spirochaeta isovalerica TaxID=150 RepID=A0A841RIH3_9SPIO|nr:acetyl-CoA C-acetyltransferase [Spirochaeta isovalerica]MBB6482539.1 acetyl-CoA C-acetyltransferase [Spirochaeta isovalerica]